MSQQPSTSTTDTTLPTLKWIPLPTPLPTTTTITPLTFTATATNPYPCRRCLIDGAPDEPMLLYSYDPFPPTSPSPYRGAGPIFVHARPCELYTGDGEVPDQQARRLLSVRAYDERDMMVRAEVAEGRGEIEGVAKGMLGEGVKYLNVHYARQGCFAVRVERGA